MKTYQMTNPSSGNVVNNQFELVDSLGNSFFQSYNTMIAKINKLGEVFLDVNYWNYSRTTGKYRNKFLKERTAETRKKIDNGEYKLVDLNEEYAKHQEEELKNKYFSKWKNEEEEKAHQFRIGRLNLRRQLNGFRD
jgi:hypothetical protein